MHECAGDRHPLHLSTGQLMGVVVCAIQKPQPIEHGVDPDQTVSIGDPIQAEWQRNVLSDRQRGEQMEELEHRGQSGSTQSGQGCVGRLLDLDPLEADLALVRAIEEAGQLEQGALATATGSHERNPFSALEAHGHAIDGANLLVTGLKGPDDIFEDEYQGASFLRGWSFAPRTSLIEIEPTCP
jgi:hypothetical protein